MPSGYHILIVDDDLDILELLKSYLSLSGYKVSTTSDSAEALKILHSNRIDLILLDIHIPTSSIPDGFQILKKIRSESVWSEIPVIFLSSFDRPNLKVKGLELGADDYITKPFDRAELQARVKVVLRRSNRFRKIENAMEGSLKEIPLSLILQTLALSSKTATIALHNPDAQIFIQDGMFVGANFSSFTGIDALTRLILGAQGDFTISFNQLPITPQTVLPIDTALLNIAPIVDETTQILIDISHLNIALDIKEEEETNSSHEEHLLRSSVMTMPGSLRENALSLKETLRN